MFAFIIEDYKLNLIKSLWIDKNVIWFKPIIQKSKIDKF